MHYVYIENNREILLFDLIILLVLDNIFTRLFFITHLLP